MWMWTYVTSPLPLQVYQEVFKVSVDAFDLYIGFASEIKCPAPTRYQFWLKGKSEDQTKCVLASCNHIHCPRHPIYCMGYSTSFHNWTISCRTIMHTQYTRSTERASPPEGCDSTNGVM